MQTHFFVEKSKYSFFSDVILLLILFRAFSDEEDIVITAKRCSHFFHKGCILNWLEKSDLCPCCREPMITEEELSAAASTLVGKSKLIKLYAPIHFTSNSFSQLRDFFIDSPGSPASSAPRGSASSRTRTSRSLLSSPGSVAVPYARPPFDLPSYGSHYSPSSPGPS